jgi:hypothetical protein
MVDGKPVQGFPILSEKLEFFSTTLRDWGWPEYALPVYPRSQGEREQMRISPPRYIRPRSIVPNTSMCYLHIQAALLIHNRTNGAKWVTKSLTRTLFG